MRAVEAAGIGSAFVRRIADRRAPADRRRRARSRDRRRHRGRHACRSPSSPTAARRSPARSTRSTRSPTSASATASGCTSTAPTACPAAATETAGAAVRGHRARRLGHARRPQVARPAEELQPDPRSATPARFEAAFGHEESYMRRGDTVQNAVERTLEYSRPLRSLKLWLAFRTHGAAAFRGWIEGTLALARELADKLRADDALRAALRADALDGLLPPRRRRRSATSTPTTRRWPPRSRRTAASSSPGARRRPGLPARLLRQLPHPARGRRLRARDGARARRAGRPSA